MIILICREDRTRGGRSTYQCSYTVGQVGQPTSVPTLLVRLVNLAVFLHCWTGRSTNQCFYTVGQVSQPTSVSTLLDRLVNLPVLLHCWYGQCFYTFSQVGQNIRTFHVYLCCKSNSITFLQFNSFFQGGTLSPEPSAGKPVVPPLLQVNQYRRHLSLLQVNQYWRHLSSKGKSVVPPLLQVNKWRHLFCK